MHVLCTCSSVSWWTWLTPMWTHVVWMSVLNYILCRSSTRHVLHNAFLVRYFHAVARLSVQIWWAAVSGITPCVTASELDVGPLLSCSHPYLTVFVKRILEVDKKKQPSAKKSRCRLYYWEICLLMTSNIQGILKMGISDDQCSKKYFYKGVMLCGHLLRHLV